MQRGARRGDPFRIGMGGEEFGLFGVGAEAGDDDQGDAVAGRGGRHLVVGGRDVRPHPLAVPIDERAAVAAAARDRRAFAAGARHRRRRFGFGARFDLLRRAGAEVELADDDRLRPHRREGGAVGEGEAEAARIDFVAPPGGERGFARPVQVGRLRDVGSGWATRSAGAAARAARGRSSRIERTAEIAARSAARWARPLPVTAPAIATSAQRRRDQDEAAAEREHERLARTRRQARPRQPTPGRRAGRPRLRTFRRPLRRPGNPSPPRRNPTDVLDPDPSDDAAAPPRAPRARSDVVALAAVLAISAVAVPMASAKAAKPSPARRPPPDSTKPSSPTPRASPSTS